MKKVGVFLFYISILCIIFSCRGNNSKYLNNNAILAKKDTTIQIIMDIPKYWEPTITDSIYKKRMLAFALNFAEKNKGKDSFIYKSLRLTFDSGSLSMVYGHLFDKCYKHLIIRIPPINTPYEKLEDPINIFLYVLKDSHFTLLCNASDSSGNETGAYQGDTLQDINGDGYKDFVVDWYSTCGCCPRADSHIYLYNPKDGSIADDLALLNPFFLPNKKLVYLMSYGWPGQIALYKCIWRGFKLDTIESVSTSYVHENMFEITNEITGAKKIVHGLPAEYNCIDQANLQWFLSAWNK